MNHVAGRHYVAIPGPSVVPERVLNAMHRAAPDIYAPEFQDMVPELIADLKEVAGTAKHAAIYITNGHGVWEAAIANTLSRGDRALVLSTGMFARSWGEAAQAMGVEVELIEFGRRSTIDLDIVSDRLKDDKAGAIKAILVVQVDTSSSVRNDIASLSQLRRDLGHPALLLVDCIACLACDAFAMDAWDVDVMLAGSQKGLMTPPGLGFLFFNDRAKESHADLRTPYWDWHRRVEPEEFYHYFWGTPPTHHLYGLREALTILLREEGLEQAISRHERIAKAVWAAFERWGENGPIALNVTNPAQRSHAITAVHIGAGHGARLRQWTAETTGLVLGIGLGMEDATDPTASGYFRLAHMGHVNAHMTLGALTVIEAGLQALSIPHGSGALDCAATELAIR